MDRYERQEVERRQKEADDLAKMEQCATDFMHCFSGPHGERVLKYLSDFCFEKKKTFIANSDLTVFNEGKRSVILVIRNCLEFDLTKLHNEPEEYVRT